MTRPRSPTRSRPSVRCSPRSTGAYPGFEVHALNNTLINEDLNKLVGDDLDGSLRLTLPITFLILLVAFGAAVAAAVPLVLALTALLGGLRDPRHLQPARRAGGDEHEPARRPHRPRGRRRLLAVHDHPLPERAAGRQATSSRPSKSASGTAGRAVFFSGLAVAVSLAGLFLVGVEMLSSMAVAMIGVVLVAVIGSLTFLPATLSHPRRPGQSRPASRSSAAIAPRARGSGRRIVNVVVRRPAALRPGGRDRRCSWWRARSATCGWARPTSRASRRASTASPRSTSSTRSGRRGRRSSSRSSSPRRTSRPRRPPSTRLEAAALRDGGVGEPVDRPGVAGRIGRPGQLRHAGRPERPGQPGDRRAVPDAPCSRRSSAALPGVHAYVTGDAAYVARQRRASSPTAPRWSSPSCSGCRSCSCWSPSARSSSRSRRSCSTCSRRAPPTGS